MEAIYLICGLAGLIWGAALLRRGGIVAGCVAVLIAACCFGHPFFRVAAGPVPITIDRILLALVAGQYLVYRRFGWADPKPWGKVDYAPLILIGLLLASVVTHDWRAQNGQPVAQWLFYYALPLALFWLARQATLDRRAAWLFLGSVALLGFYLAVTAVAETHAAWQFVFPKYIASPVHEEFFGRGRGPMLNPIGCGLFQTAGLAATFLVWPRLRFGGQLLLLVAALVFGWGIYSTMTRSVWMGAAAALLLAAGVTLPKTWRGPIVAAALVAGVLVAATQWEKMLSFKRDKHLSTKEMAESARLRPILAAVAWEMFLDRPLWGCGFGRYFVEKNAYLADRSGELPLEKARPFIQHNVFLAVLTETGLIGLAAFVATLALWMREAWRLCHDERASIAAQSCGVLLLATLVAYVVNGMFHDMSAIPTVHTLLFLTAGIATGLAARARSDADVPAAAGQARRPTPVAAT